MAIPVQVAIVSNVTYPCSANYEEPYINGAATVLKATEKMHHEFQKHSHGNFFIESFFQAHVLSRKVRDSRVLDFIT